MKKNYFYILLAGTLWGCMGIFVKILSAAGFSDMQSAAVRIVLGALFMSLYVFLTDRKAFKIRLRDAWIFMGAGVIGLFAFTVCYFSAIRLSNMAVAAVFLYTAPAFVMVMSALIFKEKITPLKLAALVLTISGCVLVSGVLGGAPVPASAVIFGLCCGICYSTYSIFGKLALERYSPATLTVYTLISAAVPALAVCNIFPALPLFSSVRVIGASLGISVVSCLLPFFFYSKGLSGCEPGKAAVMSSWEMVTASVISIVFYREGADALKIFGILLVVAAIVTMNLKTREK